MSDECDRCGRVYDELKTVELGTDREICDGCVGAIRDDIDFFKWQDRYTEEQHKRAVKLFSEHDEFTCVISSYEDGQIVLHTPYVSSNVVTDFCNHFGFMIISFTPRWKNDGVWPCETDHGDIFEIVLEYNHLCTAPIPLPAKFEDHHITQLDGNDKQF